MYSWMERRNGRDPVILNKGKNTTINAAQAIRDGGHFKTLYITDYVDNASAVEAAFRRHTKHIICIRRITRQVGGFEWERTWTVWVVHRPAPNHSYTIRPES